MVNLIQCGEIIEYVNTTGAVVKSGSLVIVGSLTGIAVTDIAIGDSGSVVLEGVAELPKAAAAFTQGQKLYWDSTNSNLTGTASGNTFVGFAWLPYASGDATARVVLSNGI